MFFSYLCVPQIYGKKRQVAQKVPRMCPEPPELVWTKPCTPPMRNEHTQKTRSLRNILYEISVKKKQNGNHLSPFIRTFATDYDNLVPPDSERRVLSSSTGEVACAEPRIVTSETDRAVPGGLWAGNVVHDITKGVYKALLFCSSNIEHLKKHRGSEATVDVQGVIIHSPSSSCMGKALYPQGTKLLATGGTARWGLFISAWASKLLIFTMGQVRWPEE